MFGCIKFTSSMNGHYSIIRNGLLEVSVRLTRDDNSRGGGGGGGTGSCGEGMRRREGGDSQLADEGRQRAGPCV